MKGDFQDPCVLFLSIEDHFPINGFHINDPSSSVGSALINSLGSGFCALFGVVGSRQGNAVCFPFVGEEEKFFQFDQTECPESPLGECFGWRRSLPLLNFLIWFCHIPKSGSQIWIAISWTWKLLQCPTSKFLFLKKAERRIHFRKSDQRWSNNCATSSAARNSLIPTKNFWIWWSSSSLNM